MTALRRELPDHLTGAQRGTYGSHPKACHGGGRRRREEEGGGGRRREEEEGGAAEPLPRKHVIVRLSHCLGYGAACYGAACYYCCLLRCGCAGPKDIHQHHSGQGPGVDFSLVLRPPHPARTGVGVYKGPAG